MRKLMDNKKALALETVVKAVIVLIVLGVVIFVFSKLFGGSADNANTQVTNTGTDWDGDGITNIIDSCCCSGEGSVDGTGCGPGDKKISCMSDEAKTKCKPKST